MVSPHWVTAEEQDRADAQRFAARRQQQAYRDRLRQAVAGEAQNEALRRQQQAEALRNRQETDRETAEQRRSILGDYARPSAPPTIEGQFTSPTGEVSGTNITPYEQPVQRQPFGIGEAMGETAEDRQQTERAGRLARLEAERRLRLGLPVSQELQVQINRESRPALARAEAALRSAAKGLGKTDEETEALVAQFRQKHMGQRAPSSMSAGGYFGLEPAAMQQESEAARMEQERDQAKTRREQLDVMLKEQQLRQGEERSAVERQERLAALREKLLPAQFTKRAEAEMARRRALQTKEQEAQIKAKYRPEREPRAMKLEELVTEKLQLDKYMPALKAVQEAKWAHNKALSEGGLWDARAADQQMDAAAAALEQVAPFLPPELLDKDITEVEAYYNDVNSRIDARVQAWKLLHPDEQREPSLKELAEAESQELDNAIKREFLGRRAEPMEQ